jgi:hypothetical protein
MGPALVQAQSWEPPARGAQARSPTPCRAVAHLHTGSTCAAQKEHLRSARVKVRLRSRNRCRDGGEHVSYPHARAAHQAAPEATRNRPARSVTSASATSAGKGGRHHLDRGGAPSPSARRRLAVRAILRSGAALVGPPSACVSAQRAQGVAYRKTEGAASEGACRECNNSSPLKGANGNLRGGQG